MLELIGMAIFAWLLAEGAEPAMYLKEKLRLTEDNMFGRLFYCSLCLGFWVGLIYFGTIYQAAIVSGLAEAVSRINKYTMTI